MKASFVIAICLLLLTACSTDDRQDRYARLIEEWQGRTVEFPSVMVDQTSGDTIDLCSADFTLLTYIDRDGCTGCRMGLSRWNIFLESLDSIAGDSEVIPIIVVNAKDARELEYLIRRDAYSYPVVNDESDSLNILNNFNENPTFRTLLLDRNKQVIAMGNPTTNPSIADLYRSIISGSKTFGASGSQLITVSPSGVDLGEIELGKEYSAAFTLKNHGRDTVFIQEIISSCHCSETSIGDSLIAPGSSLPVKVKFREDSLPGDFQRYVNIYYRNFINPTVLTLSGTVN